MICIVHNILAGTSDVIAVTPSFPLSPAPSVLLVLQWMYFCDDSNFYCDYVYRTKMGETLRINTTTTFVESTALATGRTLIVRMR